MPSATSRTSIRFSSASRYSRPLAPAEVEDHLRRRRPAAVARADRQRRVDDDDRRAGPGQPEGVALGQELRAAVRAEHVVERHALVLARSARSCPARVRMLSVLVCRTRRAPAASAASRTLTAPAVVDLAEPAARLRPQVRVGGQVVDLAAAADGAIARRRGRGCRRGPTRCGPAAGARPRAPGRSRTRTRSPAVDAGAGPGGCR